MRRLKRAVARGVRGALLRYVRAEPSPEARAGADRRVFILVTAVWGMGGTTRAALNLASYLASSHDVEIISVGRTRDEPFFGDFPAGVKVVALDDRRGGWRRLLRLPLWPLRSRSSVFMHPRDLAARGFNLWVDIQLVRALRRRAGFLITTRPGLNLVAVELAVPGLVTIGQENMHFRRHPRELRRAMVRGYRELDAFVVLTETDRRRYAKRLARRTRLVTIPNTIRSLGGPDADLAAPVVLAAGRLSYQKGFDLLIPAFAPVAARHPDWRLRICGNGPRRADLEAMVRAHGLQDAIAMPRALAAIGEEMARASIFVLSSRFEGLPLVLLEAMAKGMAVVAFDCRTGPADLIDDHGNGLLVPRRDVGALAAGIAELIEDEDLRRRCGAAAAETARDYTIDAVGPRWEQLFRELGRAPVALRQAPRAAAPR